MATEKACKDYLRIWVEWQRGGAEEDQPIPPYVDEAIAHIASCAECRKKIPGLVAGPVLERSPHELAQALARFSQMEREMGFEYAVQENPLVASYLASDEAAFERYWLSQRLLTEGLGREELPEGVKRVLQTAFPPVGLRERLRALFLAPIPWPVWASALAAVLLAFLAGLFVGPQWFGPGPTLERVAAQLQKPPWVQEEWRAGLGIGAVTPSPEALQLFEAAMGAYDDPAFPDKALPLLQQAVALDPTFDRAQYWLGVCFLLKGEVAAAIPPLEAAVRLAPGNQTYRQYLVWAYLKTGAFEKALEAQTELVNRR